MTQPVKIKNPKDQSIMQAAEEAVRAIPPAWPLAATVAVNPFLGQTGESLAQTSARLARVAGVRTTMPRDWYAAKIAAGAITEADLAAAAPAGLTAADLKAAASRPGPAPSAAPMVADLVARATGADWPAIVSDRIGVWAQGFFDEGQALWAAPRAKGAWRAWRAFASHDLTPEILGLADFAAFVEETPDAAEAAIAQATDRLGLTPVMLETYFHQALLSLGGWSQMARQRLFAAELAGGADSTTIDLLAVALTWELALYERHEAAVAGAWAEARALHATPVAPGREEAIDAALQEAADRAAQREIAASLSRPPAPAASERPALQAALCIDVRSEVYRRALEGVDPRVETLGFAGFFGLGTAHRGFASDVEELRLPVLLNPGVKTCSGGPDHKHADEEARFAARAVRAWGRFKLAAVSSFAFVESAAPLYAAKLARDAFGLDPHGAPNEPAPRLDPALPLAARIDAAEAVLRAMSLTKGFARLVLLLGHGAQVVNNPHKSALACGACGGYSGEVNARLLAALLNDADVRAALVERGIEIPADTLFVPGLHDTTSDQVTLYEQDQAIGAHAGDLAQAKRWLETAGARARGERATALSASNAPIRRGRDWAEVRPEWGLAGCRAFIAAPRSRTQGRSLEGRAFLHNYSWADDKEFKTLELILTAPVVVASWISLQYYGSTVAPSLFGGGNKLLHNIVGGVGVIEGNGGPLRVGLPWQSVHDGARYMHEPLRLSVCVEAPREAISAILARHPGVRALFDNGWLHLFAMDETGALAWRYESGLAWRPFGVEAAQAPRAEASASA